MVLHTFSKVCVTCIWNNGNGVFLHTLGIMGIPVCVLCSLGTVNSHMRTFHFASMQCWKEESMSGNMSFICDMLIGGKRNYACGGSLCYRTTTGDWWIYA